MTTCVIQSGCLCRIKPSGSPGRFTGSTTRDFAIAGPLIDFGLTRLAHIVHDGLRSSTVNDFQDSGITGSIARLPRRRPLASPGGWAARCPPVQGVGKDVLGGSGFLDLAKLVSGGGQAKSAYKDLAYKIGAHLPSSSGEAHCIATLTLICPKLCHSTGKDIYVDVQGWHLYLKDVTVEKDLKMNQVKSLHCHAPALVTPKFTVSRIVKYCPGWVLKSNLNVTGTGRATRGHGG